MPELQPMLAVSGGEGSTTAVLGALFIALLAAKLGDELFKRLGRPTLIGEILAGVVIGPSVLGIVEPSEALEAFADLGVVFLLFWIGLATPIHEFRGVGRASVQAGLLGALVPCAAGIGLGLALGREFPEAVFIGAALAATSVGITASLMDELGITDSRPGKAILGAAVVDDIAALLIFAVAAGLAGGETSLVEVAVTFVVAVAFVAFVALGGTAALRRRPHVLLRPRFATGPGFVDSPLLPAVLLCLGLAALSSLIGLAAVIGAFLAGMIVAEAREVTSIREEVAPLYAFFPPFFLVFVGLRLDLGALIDPATLGLLAAVVVVAVVSKFAGSAFGALPLGRADALLVGVGMVPRAEVAVVIASLGLAFGAVTEDLFAVIVAMTVLTATFVGGPFRRLAARSSAEPAVRPG